MLNVNCLRLIVLYHTAHNPYLGNEQEREQNEEDEERKRYAARLKVGYGCYSRQHVLNTAN